MTSAQPEAAWPEPRPLAFPRSRARLAERLKSGLPLGSLLALTAVLYLWGLSRSGYANEFYAAAVKAGTLSWKAFLFGSLDPSNFITVDKPPASLWLMELSGRLFGFSSFSMLLPQALAGVASVWLVYATVRRWFSQPAALLSGLILAVTPVAALMFRFNNPDALLVLLLVAGAYAVTRALERGSTWWLALAGAAVGFGFLTKMMQAFLVLPAFALVYLVAAPPRFLRRVWQVLVAGVAMVVACGWWIAIVELVPASARPYVGGSTGNSVLDLVWNYNGLGRISGGSGPGGGGGFGGTPGILRLFNGEFGGQISWLLPAALIVLGAGLVATLRAPRTDRTRAALLLWGGWLVVTGVVFSLMSGVIHPYYTNTLAPPIAVLAGAGSVELWRRRHALAARLALASLLLVTAWWSYRLLERTPGWHPWLRSALLAGGIAAAVAVVAVGGIRHRAALAALVAAGVLAGLGGSIAYTLDTVATAHAGSTPSAGPLSAGGFGGFGGGALRFTAARSGGPGGTGGPGGGATASKTLTALLVKNASAYTWVAATGSSNTAAPLELATGKAVMAIGGFTGSDRSITLARFEQLVAAGRIHYYVGGGDMGGGGPGGGQGVTAQIASWVAGTFKATTVGGTSVYDLTQKAS